MPALRAKENDNDRLTSVRLDKASKRDLDSSLALLNQMFGMKVTQRVLIQRCIQMYADFLTKGVIESKRKADEPKLRIGKDLSQFQEFHNTELRELYEAAGRGEEEIHHDNR